MRQGCRCSHASFVAIGASAFLVGGTLLSMRARALARRLETLLDDVRSRLDRLLGRELLRSARNAATQTASSVASRAPPPPPVDDFVCVRRYEDAIAPLTHILAADWVYDKPIVTIDENASAFDALASMHASRSSCAIVQSESKELLGVLALFDAVRYMLRGSHLDGPTARGLLRLCIMAPPTLSLSDVCCHLRSGFRHVAIAKRDGTHQIVSQRSVARALREFATTDPRILQPLRSSLATSHLPSWGAVMCAADTWTARTAFESMAAYDVTSLPVCDSEGRALAVISASDILYARTDANRLADNVLAFVAASRASSEHAIPARKVVACTPAQTLEEALETMLDQSVHHIYVLDDGQRPLAVVSFVDILRLL